MSALMQLVVAGEQQSGSTPRPVKLKRLHIKRRRMAPPAKSN